MPEKKASNAANPPAEAPIPTMGKAVAFPVFRAAMGDFSRRGLGRLFFKQLQCRAAWDA
jgi:hypothetical protein